VESVLFCLYLFEGKRTSTMKWPTLFCGWVGIWSSIPHHHTMVAAFRSSLSSNSARSITRICPARKTPVFQERLNSNAERDNSENDDNEIDLAMSSSSSPSPKSRMNDYVTRFLDKNTPPLLSSEEETIFDASRLEKAKLTNIADATHLIAIPMERSYELMLELESVQRAILYHCPILLDACISAASTRLPLLYIQATTEKSMSHVTTALGKLVDRLVQKHIFRAESNSYDNKDLNVEGFRPVTMTFQSLEIEGENNSILSTVGFLENDAKDDERVPESTTSVTRFTNFMQELQSAVVAQGWKMALPPDPDNGKNHDVFRPRISFMELPTSFDENISLYKSIDKKLTEEEMEFLTSAQGGNGISPIFWCQWWDDVFARNVRMREICIYPRNQMGGIMARNSQFFSPVKTIPLPDGSPSMLQSERKFQEYQEQRLEKEQDLVYQANQANDSDGIAPPKTVFATTNSTSLSSNASDPDLMMAKTRQRLERIFLESGGESSIDLQDGVGLTDEPRVEQRIDSSKASNSEDVEGKVEGLDLKSPNHPIQPKEDDFMEDWMKERIKRAVNSLESMKVRNPEKKEMPPIKDNPIFKAYKEGTLVPVEENLKKKEIELGPYPGNDHFIGIWRVVASPTGVNVDDSDENTSENLILRVDGTIAGGPTLNLETRQKAAGGTWKIIAHENGEVVLRIRLVIPPEKNRILVMEGLVERLGPQAGIPMASRTFGIPQVEDRAKKYYSKDLLLHLMTCSGKVRQEFVGLP
jgi:hypothetical protein